MATSTTVPAVKEFNTSVENAVAFTRGNGEQVNFALQHFGDHHELDLAVFNMADSEQPEIRDLVTLSLAEAKMLRVFLNRDEIVCQLDAAE